MMSTLLYEMFTQVPTEYTPTKNISFPKQTPA